MGKVILVTGASQGIGAATAVLAGERGYSVCVNYLSSEDAADATVETIRGAGGRAIAVRADVGSQDDVLQPFARVDRELGPAQPRDPPIVGPESDPGRRIRP